MQKNELLKNDELILRVLDFNHENACVINCRESAMPYSVGIDTLQDFTPVTEEDLLAELNVYIQNKDELSSSDLKKCRGKYDVIASALPYVGEPEICRLLIDKSAKEHNLLPATVRRYLVKYLIFQDIAVFAPEHKKIERHELTADEKNIRWALNKWYYSPKKFSLADTYTMMISEKYTSPDGKIFDTHPSIYQLRYYYRKHKRTSTYYCSRDGLSDYRRNHRPHLGDIYSFADSIGMYMIDSTVCDIYLINDAGALVGRPLLTVAIDARSSLCTGYTLGWEGGNYSVRGLLNNIVTEKVAYCREFGVLIGPDEWNCQELPHQFITDRGTEFTSADFEQISELGVTITNVEAYRADLKCFAERFFGLVQSAFRPYLHDQGVIQPDFQERGAVNYRKQAKLTLRDFEIIVLRCIVFYNNSRVIENYPFTGDMLDKGIKPYASSVWNYLKEKEPDKLITATPEKVALTLLPRTRGKFTRKGLIVGKIRYKHTAGNYTQKYLEGGDVSAAYNPDCVDSVWLVEKEGLVRFELIESRYRGMSYADVEQYNKKCRDAVLDVQEESLQARVNLAGHINAAAASAAKVGDVSVKGIRDTRAAERKKNHRDYTEWKK